MHGFQGALFSFFLFLFLFFVLFYLIFFVCLISVFWPHPGEPSAFDFSLYGYMVNFLSHSSEMETFKYSLYLFIYLFILTLLIMLLVIYCRVWGQTKRVTVTRSLQALWINLWVKGGLSLALQIAHKFWKCLLGLFSAHWVHWGLHLFSAWKKFPAVVGGGEMLKKSALLL